MNAATAIRPAVAVTPLYQSRRLGELAGAEVFLKAEHLHSTGSFKLRGAINKLHCIGRAERTAGIVTASSGNHGLAVAQAGATLGVPVTVFVAETASPVKVAAIRALGATLETVSGAAVEAELLARAVGERTGRIYVSPYNDLDVIAGQGTIGLEIAAQRSDLDAVFVAVGGGGLISGLGSALKRVSPRTSVIGVWPENSPYLLRAMEVGKLIDVEDSDTISDGTAGAIEPGAVTLDLALAVVDETLTVSELEIKAAMRHVAMAERWIIEGAAGVAVAGLLKSVKRDPGRRVAAVICGRNIELGRFLDAIQR